MLILDDEQAAGGKGGTKAMLLDKTQVKRLMAVLNAMVIVNSSQPSHLHQQTLALPTFACRPIDFIEVLLRNLEEAEVCFKGVRLYGGAASYVISESAAFYNDIDLMIHIDFDTQGLHFFLDKIKECVLKSLREIVSEILHKMTDKAYLYPMDDMSLTSSYVAKMYKHAGDPAPLGKPPEKDSLLNIWSLFSFNNFQGRNIEVKFVHTLERQYKFSIDSFQIDLSKEFLLIGQHYQNEWQLDEATWPSTTCHCLYPDLKQALADVKNRRIRVLRPDTVRGGCFLRYAGLLARNFNKDPDLPEVKMCTRFLSDFEDLNAQSKAVDSYMHNHMGACGSHYKREFLRKLEETVNRLLPDIEDEAVSKSAESLATVVRTKLVNFDRPNPHDSWAAPHQTRLPPRQTRLSPYY